MTSNSIYRHQYRTGTWAHTPYPINSSCYRFFYFIPVLSGLNLPYIIKQLTPQSSCIPRTPKGPLKQFKFRSILNKQNKMPIQTTWCITFVLGFDFPPRVVLSHCPCPHVTYMYYKIRFSNIVSTYPAAQQDKRTLIRQPRACSTR